MENEKPNIENEQTVGQRLTKARKFVELSQKNISELTGIARSTISKLENDESKDYMDLAMFYFRTYEISLEWILAGWGGSEVVLRNLHKEELLKGLSENERQILQRILQVAHDLEKKKNISFKEFCERTGLDYQNFHFYNIGNIRLTFDQLINISNVFLIDPKWLLTGNGEMLSDENPIVDISINKLNLLAHDFDFFKNNLETISSKLWHLDHHWHVSGKQLFRCYYFLENTDFNKIMSLINKPLLELNENDLRILNLERTFINVELRNLYFCIDFNEAKTYFNRTNEGFEKLEFRFSMTPDEIDYPTLIDYKVGFEEFLLKPMDDISRGKNKTFKMRKIKDILTTEDLINDILNWIFKW